MTYTVNIGKSYLSKFCIKIGSAARFGYMWRSASHFGMHIFMSDVIEETREWRRWCVFGSPLAAEVLEVFAWHAILYDILNVWI